MLIGMRLIQDRSTLETGITVARGAFGAVARWDFVLHEAHATAWLLAINRGSQKACGSSVVFFLFILCFWDSVVQHPQIRAHPSGDLLVPHVLLKSFVLSAGKSASAEVNPTVVARADIVSFFRVDWHQTTGSRHPGRIGP